MAQTRSIPVPPGGPVLSAAGIAPPGIGELVGGLAGDVQELVRGEIALARSEFEQKLQRLLLASGRVLGGALFAFAGLVVLLGGIAGALALVLPAWLAALIVGIVAIVAGGLLAWSGTGMLSLRELSPDRTAASLEKDTRMLKEHL